MNILIIGTTDILGGAAKVSWDIKSALQNAGHTVSMFVADKRSNDPNVRVIPRVTWRKYLGFLFATERWIDTDWLLDTDEFKNADIVHCHNLHGRFFNLETLQKMSCAKPVVWTLHDEWALTPHCAYTLEGTTMSNGLYVCPSIDTQPRLLWNNSKQISIWKNSIYKKMRDLHVITPSLWLLQRVQNTLLNTYNPQCIPNGIDTSIYSKTDATRARNELGLPIDKKIILFLATDAKNNTWKGWKYTERIISQFENRDDVLFLNVGNLVDHPDTKNIRYVGHISDQSILAKYYSAADALLFTSIAENFPLVILEAMSCGLPIVSFNVGGVSEVVAHKENGYIADYLNTDELAKGLTWLLAHDPSDIHKISLQSAEKIRRDYDIKNMIDGYIKLYETIYSKS